MEGRRPLQVAVVVLQCGHVGAGHLDVVGLCLPFIAQDGSDELVTGFAARVPRGLVRGPATTLVLSADGGLSLTDDEFNPIEVLFEGVDDE